MDTCARCGKDLNWMERNTVFWNSHLKKGYIKWSVIGTSLYGTRKEFPEYTGKKLCQSCVFELFEYGNHNCKGSNSKSSVEIKLNEDINRAIFWQNDESLVTYTNCQEFFEDKTKLFGADFGHKGFLVVTNQRVLFVCKQGRWAKDYGIIYGANLEDIMAVSSGRFGGNDKLIILDKNSQQKQFIEPKIDSLVPMVNSAISERKNKLQARKEREHVQIILDFSSLKDAMSKGGLIMTTYKCPNCNGMVDIPEAGKVLMCQYCGTPIKPVDIFEKVKALIE